MLTVSASLLFVAMIGSGDAESSGKTTVHAQENAPAPSVQSDADTIRQRVKEGQKVRITDDQGREWHGRIGSLAPDKLTLVTKDPQPLDLPYGRILRIDRPHDGLGNGAWIGLTSGAVLGLLAVVAEESDDCESAGFFDCGDPGGAAYLGVPLILGGLGAAVGVGIDALIRKEPNLFRRASASRMTVAPAIRRGVRGVIVSLQW